MATEVRGHDGRAKTHLIDGENSMKSTLLAVALGAAAVLPAAAEPVKYNLDPSHSQIVYSYNHLGYSTTYGMFGGITGEVMFDAEAPAASSVSVSFPVASMLTGWEERLGHFMSPDFFNAEVNADVTFTSTAIEVTGESTAMITGDLTMNGITKPVVLDAKLNSAGEHPMAKKAWAGFDATATVLRSDYGLEKFAPFVSDEVEVMISIETEIAG